MADELAPREIPAPDDAAIAKAHAVYTVHAVALRPAGARLVELLRLALPTRRLLDLYLPIFPPIIRRPALAPASFWIGVTQSDRLVLLDINRHCLDRAARRLARFNPPLYQANLLAPIALDIAPVSSVGLTYVLHCLPGRMRENLAAVDHLRPLMQKDAALFGATILGRGIAPNPAARALLAFYNAKGVFNNREDDLASLSDGLRQRFGEVEIETQGCVALFRVA